ncbi:hypothetical protein ACJX0J_006016, partial [Zea mays]
NSLIESLFFKAIYIHMYLYPLCVCVLLLSIMTHYQHNNTPTFSTSLVVVSDCSALSGWSYGWQATRGT